MQKKVRVNYVDNAQFYQAICDYHLKLRKAQSAGEQEPIIPDYIGDCIYKIAKNLAVKPCFANYSFKEEMIGDGIENCIKSFRNFDPDYGKNPFAYFTQVVYYAFLRRIESEELARYGTYKNFHETMIACGDMRLLVDHDGNQVVSSGMYDNLLEFMKKFEDKLERKKAKRKAKKAEGAPDGKAAGPD